MRVFGIDFTSAPRAAKPITCAVCTLDNDHLVIDELRAWADFDRFESFFLETEPSITGIDLPFGQPLRFVQALGWPTVWEEYVKIVGVMSKPEFVETITSYCDQQPAGDKHHLRQTDELAGACSPMMLYGVPVGKMFFEGAPKIGAAGVSVLPCRPNESCRVVVEAYSALVARRLIGRASYKNGSNETRPQKSGNRRRIINSFQLLLEDHGITVHIANSLREQLISDHTGAAFHNSSCVSAESNSSNVYTNSRPSFPWSAKVVRAHWAVIDIGRNHDAANTCCSRAHAK